MPLKGKRKRGAQEFKGSRPSASAETHRVSGLGTSVSDLHSSESQAQLLKRVEVVVAVFWDEVAPWLAASLLQGYDMPKATTQNTLNSRKLELGLRVLGFPRRYFKVMMFQLSRFVCRRKV